MMFANATKFHRKSGEAEGSAVLPTSFKSGLESPAVHREELICLRQIEGKMTRQRSQWMQGPEGRPQNVSPARKGWETKIQADPNAVGAALNRSPTLCHEEAYPDFLLAA
jgi:hypothetical protein